MATADFCILAAALSLAVSHTVKSLSHARASCPCGHGGLPQVVGHFGPLFPHLGRAGCGDRALWPQSDSSYAVNKLRTAAMPSCGKVDSLGV